MVQQTKSATKKQLPLQVDSNNKHKEMASQKKDSLGGGQKKDNRGQNGSGGFRTDTAISGNKGGQHRQLQRWQPEGDDSDTFGSALENSNNGAAWDQFAANEKLFGVKSNYDDHFYTTQINKNAPDYASKLAAADKLARAIEKSTSSNAHIREERTMDHSGPELPGLNEEDKYSGVLPQEFPALVASKNAWVAPHKRAPTAQPTVSGAPVDPAIITTARPKPVSEEAKQTQPSSSINSATLKSQLSIPPFAGDTKPSTPEAKSTATTSSTSASRIASPAQSGAPPSAAATVERDLATAFRTFATRERTTVERMRTTRAKADKESKLSDLKKFAETFKLNSPVPSDLVSIIAKDPAKQREIQEKSKQNAADQQDKLAKLKATESASTSTAPDAKVAQRNGPAGIGPTTTNSQGRQSNVRGVAGSGSIQLGSQPFRSGPNMQAQQGQYQGRQPPNPSLGQRLKNLDQSYRSSPSGTAHPVDPSFSRRSSGATSFAKLNPSTQEFRPNAFAQSFVPPGNPSSSSSPRAGSVTGSAVPQSASPAGSIMRKKLNAGAKPFIKADFDVIAKIAKAKCPPGKEKAWAANGNFQPAYDDPPTWRVAKDDEPANSTMNLTYQQVLSQASIGVSTASNHTSPPVAHQHQLPFHLQQGAQGMRGSSRQPFLQGHLQNGHFANGEEQRMMPSHSAQSFVNSPRMQNVPIAYASPIAQPQMMYGQGVQYAIGGPQTPQMAFRSYSSGGPQFMPQQSSPMGGPVMMQGPGGNNFMGPGLSPGPQMLYPANGQFMQGPPPLMPGTNGYPSPGRGGTMMMQQGSQQGHQSGYGLSPGMQFSQPIFAQSQQGQMPASMRGSFSQSQQFSTSPQMHHQFHQHRSQNNYNKNFQGSPNSQGSHSQMQAQNPANAQPRSDGNDDAK